MRARLSTIGFFLLCLLPSLATAESLAGVQSQAEQQLQQAEQKLAALRKEIEADTVPLTRKLNELEEKLTQVKTQFEDVDRTLASKQLENTNLQSEVKRKTEENAYLGSLMEEFSRGMETKLFSGEAGRYKPILESAKAAVGNPDLGQSDKFKFQLAVVKSALARTSELVGGARFPGSAVDSRGNLVEGSFAMFGPAAYFASNHGDLQGLAVVQTSSPNPIVREIPSAIDMAEPHEKVGMLVDMVRGQAEDIENRPGIRAIIADSGEGWLPLDPSKGAALKGLINKFNLVETFIHGGWIMWPILAASIAGFAVALERFFFVLNEGRKRSPKKLQQFFAACEKHDFDGAVAISKTTKDFIVRALGYALEHRDTSLHSALVYSSTTAMKRFNRGLAVLDTVITLSPMLGLLGTVTGMMASFESISGGDGNPTAVMGGITEALIATAAGLGIALVCVLPYNYLNSKIEVAQRELDSAAARLELLIQVAEQVAQEKKRIENQPPPPAPSTPIVVETKAPAPKQSPAPADDLPGDVVPA
jgi:biopolymer transport protein ExbB